MRRNRFLRTMRMLVPATLILAHWFGTTQLVSAQVIFAPAAVPAAPEDEPDEEDPAAMQQRGVVFGGIDESNFEAWIWNGTVNSAAAGKARLQSQLDLQIAEIARVCQLTEAQSQKLKLAGASDIKRFFDRYTKLRKHFMKVRHDQNLMNNFWAELQPLQMEIQSGLFNDESMLLRVVPKALDESQRETYEREALARRTYRMQAKLELLLVAADESLGLRIDQREKLTELCRKYVRVPRRFGQYDSYVIIYELSRIPETEAAAILDPDQMKGWQQATAQGRGMEQFLRQNKMLPEFDAPANPNAGAEPAVNQPAEKQADQPEQPRTEKPAEEKRTNER